MEEEKVHFMNAWLSHMVRSVHLPPSTLRDVMEGKTPGSRPFPGVRMDDDFVFTMDIPEPEKRVATIKDLMILFYRYLVLNYDENIARRHLISPAREFVDRNKEKVDALGLTDYIHEHLNHFERTSEVEGWMAAIPSGTSSITSGTPGFDEMEWGGLPKTSSILLQGPGGKEMDKFVNQFVRQGLQDGDPVLVIMAGMSPDDFTGQMLEMGVQGNVLVDGSHLQYIDWYSYKFERISGIEEIDNTIKVSKDLTNVRIAVNKAMRTMPARGSRRAVVEILSSAMADYPREMVVDFVKTTREKFKGSGITALFIARKETVPTDGLPALHRVLDGVVDIAIHKTSAGVMPSVSILSAASVQSKEALHPMSIDGKGVLKVDAVGSMPTILETIQVMPDAKRPGAPEPGPATGEETPEPAPVPAPPPSEGPSAMDILRRLRSGPTAVETPPAPEAPTRVPKLPSLDITPEPSKPPVLTPPRTPSPPSGIPLPPMPKPPKERTGQAPAPPPPPPPKPSDPLQAKFAEASAFSRAGKRAEAIAVYDDILKKDPNAREALMKRAVLLQVMGRHEHAVDSYDRALRLDAADAEAWSNRGISLRAMNMLTEAIESYDNALRCDPKDAGVWSNRGIALRAMGLNDDAIASYDKALEINPRDASVWSNRGVLLTMLSRYEEALYSFDQALTANPNYTKARKNREILLEKMR